MAAEWSGPATVCASCSMPVRGYIHTVNGWICKPCLLQASTRIEVIYIHGRRFTRILKGHSEQPSTWVAEELAR